ncbi:MAG TPA: hypothetical protein VL171_11720 [Verrucomicrobiae bacterium]|nr:hypothetical protein [Verrucomicrobiae bacterium]
MRRNPIERKPSSGLQDSTRILFGSLASARVSTVDREINGLIVVITDGEGCGAPVA